MDFLFSSRVVFMKKQSPHNMIILHCVIEQRTLNITIVVIARPSYLVFLRLVEAIFNFQKNSTRFGLA